MEAIRERGEIAWNIHMDAAVAWRRAENERDAEVESKEHIRDAAYKHSSIFWKVVSACSKKPKTILRENSRSTGSSSISSICSNVIMSMASPQSGPAASPSSD
jgi:hypothetical protein